MRIALEARGFLVFDADRGERGIEVCSRVRPDVVVVDYRMPGIDGMECCRRLVPMFADGLPIIMLSGREESTLPEQARQAGVGRFLQKPTNWVFLAGLASDLVANTGRNPTSP